MNMNFGVRLPTTGPISSAEGIELYAQYAESLGYNAVTAHDHVYHSYHHRYHNAGGLAEFVDLKEKMGLPITNIFDALTAFSYVAGKTKNIRMIPCALVLPIRHPILFAKQAITLDHLSDGRFICTVCAGDIPSDFAASAVEFDLRGKIMDEYLKVLKQAFTTGKISFKGKYITVPEFEISPKPKNLPIWIATAGTSTAGLRRIAQYADDGCFAPGVDRAKLRDFLRKYGRKETDIKEYAAQTFLCIGKDGDQVRRNVRRSIEIFFSGEADRHSLQERVEGTLNTALVGTPDEVIGKVEKFREAGLNFLDMRINAESLEGALQMIKLFAKEVMPSFTS